MIKKGEYLYGGQATIPVSEAKTRPAAIASLRKRIKREHKQLKHFVLEVTSVKKSKAFPSDSLTMHRGRVSGVYLGGGMVDVWNIMFKLYR